MNEVDDNTQANVALTLEEKITDRVRKALVEVLRRGATDHYVQDMINQRITDDIRLIMDDPHFLHGSYQFNEFIRKIIKEEIIAQMHKN